MRGGKSRSLLDWFEMYNQYAEGWIEIICGCMFAGKTEELIRRINVL